MDDPGHTSRDTIENSLELTADYANRQSFQALNYLDGGGGSLFFFYCNYPHRIKKKLILMIQNSLL